MVYVKVVMVVFGFIFLIAYARMTHHADQSAGEYNSSSPRTEVERTRLEKWGRANVDRPRFWGSLALALSILLFILAMVVI